ncbi:MAG TPA: HlyD family efflux transporter periplasmic adaptor subunit [Steroidobacteraceae bacterium]
MSQNRRKLIAIGAVALVVTAALLTSGFGLVGDHEESRLVLSGNVDIRQVDLGFRVMGRIAAIPFEEGGHVAAGAVLARLDAAPYEAAAATTLSQVGVAEAALAKQRNGNRKQDIAQAQARLDESQATLVRAKADLDRRTPLLQSGAVSQALYDSTLEQYHNAQGQVAVAQQALSLQREGARREDIEAAMAQQREAVAQNNKANIDLADTVLRAPNAGTILTRVREPGAIVQPGETVMTLTIERPMRVRAYVDEPDLHRIAPGMRVLVSADGNPKTYHGTIGYISAAAEFTPKTVETTALRTDLVYRLRVIVDDPDDALRQGAPVSVTIEHVRQPDRAHETTR